MFYIKYIDHDDEFHGLLCTCNSNITLFCLRYNLDNYIVINSLLSTYVVQVMFPMWMGFDTVQIINL